MLPMTLKSTEDEDKTSFPEKILKMFLITAKSPEDEETNFADEILKMCPGLLFQANRKGETPLHLAAKYGHVSVVKKLIEHATGLGKHLESGQDFYRTMLLKTTKKNDTPLHEAVRFHHLEVVKILIEADRGISYSANAVGETPLYLAAEREYLDLVDIILEKCQSLAYDGPNGRTALHAVVLRNNEGTTTKDIHARGFYLFYLVMLLTH